MYKIYVRLRDEKGVKDADVSRATGITRSTFTDWKNGRSVPKDEKLQKIADYFGVSAYYLRTGKKPIPIEIDPKPYRAVMDKLYEKAAPGLSRVIDLYCLFDEQDRKEILGLMEIKYEMYKDEEGDDNANR